MYHKLYTIIILVCGLFIFANNTQAAVSVDFGDGFSVTYNNGTPSPASATSVITITNDESGPLTVSELVIDSTSISFVRTEDNGDQWSCSYIQTTPAPNFTGTTICVPNDVTVLEVGESMTFEIEFSFENTSNGSRIVPRPVELTDIILNGISRMSQVADLGGFDWNIDVIDDVDPDTESESVEDLETSAIVRGYVYFDDNNNNKRDDNEQGVNGVRMKLHYAGPDDKFDTGDDERYTDKTNEQGKYRFNDLASGAYRLKIEDGQMTEFYLTAEKDAINGKSSFSLDDGETKERDFGYNRDRDSNGNPRNNNLSYLQSGFTLSISNIINYLSNLIK